jgi:hypothetical protein
MSFSVDVLANSVVAVQVPLGGETDVLESERRRELVVALAEAEGRMANARDEIETLTKALM